VGTVTLRRLALVSIALVILAGPTRRHAMAQCALADTFTFQVERPNRTPAKGLDLAVEARGAPRVRVVASVSVSGSLKICIPKASAGDVVDVYVGSEAYRVLYPSRGRVTLSREDSPSIVVCEAHKDCALMTAADISALIQKSQSQVRSMTASERAAFFRDWAAYARQLSTEMNANNAQLLAALFRKERQVAAASSASVFLKQFINRARELLVRFERHAEHVLVVRDREARAHELEEMKKAYLAYNPIFDELREKSDAYLKDTSDYWSPEVSGQLRALFDEALQIHQNGIYPLNTSSMLINDCIRQLPRCPGPDAALKAVQEATKTVRDVTSPQLDRFEKRAKQWLGSLDDQLFDDPAVAPPRSPPAKR
jgi:hypothetical protein